MSKQNRVTPFGNLISTTARGTLMGNRGHLHDDCQQIRRHFCKYRRWIICLLEFKGRQRTIMMPGQYTELFFLDEATALAAGHRPCAECQRVRFNLFREIWSKANAEIVQTSWPAAGVIDAVLHSERIPRVTQLRTYCESRGNLPDGTFITSDGNNAYLVLRNQLLLWTPQGYECQFKYGISSPVYVLTPLSIVRTLISGYPVRIHPSAFQAIG